MITEKYTPNSLSIGSIIGLINSGDIAIPEIQRPFVWKKKQVRDLMDSLYKGYPTGYLIIWKSSNVRLKDGSMSVREKDTDRRSAARDRAHDRHRGDSRR